MWKISEWNMWKNIRMEYVEKYQNGRTEQAKIIFNTNYFLLYSVMDNFVQFT